MFYFNVFKITKVIGPSQGQDLLGLLVIQSDRGLGLVDPEPSLKLPRVLSTALINLNRPPVGSFGHFHLDHLPFTLVIDTVNTKEIHGTWFPGLESNEGEVDDTWTATSTGIGAGGDDEALA